MPQIVSFICVRRFISLHRLVRTANFNFLEPFGEELLEQQQDVDRERNLHNYTLEGESPVHLPGYLFRNRTRKLIEIPIRTSVYRRAPADTPA